MSNKEPENNGSLGQAVVGSFTLLGLGVLVLVGLDLLVEGHLPSIQLVLGGGAIVLGIGIKALLENPPT